MSGMGYLHWNYWPVRYHRPYIDLKNYKLMPLLSRTWWEDSIAEDTTLMSLEHGEIKLLLTWRFYLYLIGFMVLEDSIHSTKEENKSSVYLAVDPEFIVMIRLARYTHWYSSGVNVIEVSHHFLSRFKICFTRWNPYLAQLLGPRTYD